MATWQCSDLDGEAFCTLWGVDVARVGRWGKQSVFVIDGPKSVERVGFEDACRGGRCSRPEYSVCSIPVSEVIDEALLKARPVGNHPHGSQDRSIEACGNTS